jgi:alpha-1,3-rhamnosyl/mannosyltransferase
VSARYPRLIFDDRSTRANRTTGWERYCRQLLAALGDHVVAAGLGGRCVAARLRADWITLPYLARRGAVIHYPTFPPLAIDRPFVWTVHDLTWWKFPQFSSRLGRAYYARFARRALGSGILIADSYAIADELTCDFDVAEERLVVARLGCTPLPRPAPEIARFAGVRPFILMVGSIEPRKNLVAAVNAYRTSGVSKTHDLRIFGRLAWGVLPQGAILESDLSDQRLAELYATASALLVPSFYEGFGLPLIEGLASGTPVLCSDIPAFREVGATYCRYFDPYSSESMVDAFRQAAVIERAPVPEAWLGQFTWAKCAEDTLRAYTRVLRLAGHL